MYRCLECDRLFRTLTSAQRAADYGCPDCDGTDIDVADYEEREEAREEMLRDAGIG